MNANGWFYQLGNERLGPVSLAALQTLVRNGKVGRETRVWAEGLTEPVAAGTLSVLFPPDVDTSLKYLVPVGRSGYAIAAGYLGIMPFIPFAPFLAVLFAILGIRDLRRHPEKLGWGRIITGLVLGGLFSIVYLAVIVAALTSK
jgi:hypothetical protein